MSWGLRAVDNVLTIDLSSDQPAVVLDVACNVKERDLLDAYPTKHGTSVIVGLNGPARVMDKRFSDDLHACIERTMLAATQLLVAGIVPRKDKGDLCGGSLGAADCRRCTGNDFFHRRYEADDSGPSSPGQETTDGCCPVRGTPHMAIRHAQKAGVAL